MACHSENSATANRSNCGLDNFTSLFTYEEELMILVPWTVLITTSAVMYIPIFVAVLSGKEFRTAPGYLLMLSLGVSDMFYLASNMLSRFPISYLFHHGIHIDDNILKGLYSFVCGNFVTSLLHVLIIGYNRYVAVKKYEKYKHIFSRKRTFCFITLAWLTGIVTFVGGILIPGIACAQYDPSYFTFIQPSNVQDEMNNVCISKLRTFLIVFLALLMIVPSVFFYISVINTLRKVRKVVTQAPTQPSTSSQSAGCDAKVSKAKDSHSLPLTIQFLVVTCVLLICSITSTAKSVLDDVTYLKSKYLIVFSSTAWVVNFTINRFIYIGVNRRLRRAAGLQIRKVLDKLSNISFS